jgi:hypothetical protein
MLDDGMPFDTSASSSSTFCSYEVAPALALVQRGALHDLEDLFRQLVEVAASAPSASSAARRGRRRAGGRCLLSLDRGL